MIKDQFIFRYASDIATIFSVFNDLQACHNGNFVIYYDGRTWELFDVLLATTPIRHDARHVLDFIKDMKTLHHDILKVISIGVLNRPKDKLSQSCALRHLKEQYPETWSYFLPKTSNYEPEH